jgi:hypothetical protein
MSPMSYCLAGIVSADPKHPLHSLATDIATTVANGLARPERPNARRKPLDLADDPANHQCQQRAHFLPLARRRIFCRVIYVHDMLRVSFVMVTVTAADSERHPIGTAVSLSVLYAMRFFKSLSSDFIRHEVRRCLQIREII